jgi:hypothetical protein
MDVRFALSKDDLNIISKSYFLFRRTSSAATSFKHSCDSITHGPAIIIGFICYFDINNSQKVGQDYQVILETFAGTSEQVRAEPFVL